MKIKILDYKDVVQGLPQAFSLDSLREYLDGGRHDVLYNLDIFCENVRTINRKEKDFSYFEVADEADVIIFPIYLELFMFNSNLENIRYCIDKYSKMYQSKKVIFYYNHDVDFSIFNSFVENYENVIILNYNTSKKGKNDLILPFWSMEDTSFIESEKKYFCSFIGSITHPIRRKLCNEIFSNNNKDYVYFNNLKYNEYRKKMSESVFSLCPRGAGLSSYRFFECIHANTIPVLIADDVTLPYQEDIDYKAFCLRVSEADGTNLQAINDLLKQIDQIELLSNLRAVRSMFTLEGVQKYVFNNVRT